MLNVCTIGIGNAGNQIADLAMHEKKIPGIAINSSKKDLSTVKNISTVTIGDDKGSGKNRDEAKKFVKEQVRQLLETEKFVDHIRDRDVVFIISSTGGGTGSGMSPMMTDILSRKYRDQLFILVEVFPPLKESIAAQQNTIDYLQEVNAFLPTVTYMAYDNNKFSELPTSEMMKKINEEIVEHIDVIRGQYLYSTPFNSIDDKDAVMILNTPGRLCVYGLYGIKEKDLDTKSIEEMMIDTIKKISSNVELDRDKIIKKSAIITNLNEKLNSQFNTNMPEIHNLIGEPVEGFEHIYICEKGEENRVILIMSGLSVPDDRLEKIMQRIESGMAELTKSKASLILGSADTDAIKELRGSSTHESAIEFSLDDIFDQY